jgi:hypothetical protein
MYGPQEEALNVESWIHESREPYQEIHDTKGSIKEARPARKKRNQSSDTSQQVENVVH